MDASACLADCTFRAGFASGADRDTWTGAGELYVYADDAAKHLAVVASLFTAWDASVTVTAGTAVYDLPATHVFTLAAWLGSQLLRLTPVRDLWALDGAWSAATGAATRASLDAGKVGTITLYPNPTAGGTLGQVCQEFPAAIEQGATTIPLPAVLQDYLTYAMLAGWRGREGDYAQQDMAAHFRERMALYEQISEHLWGPGQ